MIQKISFYEVNNYQQLTNNFFYDKAKDFEDRRECVDRGTGAYANSRVTACSALVKRYELRYAFPKN